MIFHFWLFKSISFFYYWNFTVLFKYLIKYYNIMCIIIVFWLGGDRQSERFLVRFPSCHTHPSILAVFVCFFNIFHSCYSHARVFGKTLVHEFPISNSHTKWHLLFSASATTSANENPVRSERNTDSLINLNTKLKIADDTTMITVAVRVAVSNWTVTSARLVSGVTFSGWNWMRA